MGLKSNESSNCKKSEGLAILLQQESASERHPMIVHDKVEELNSAVKYVLNVDKSSAFFVQDRCLNLPAISTALGAQLDDIKALATEIEYPEGSVGPERVDIDVKSVYGKLHPIEEEEDALAVESRDNFSSCRATNCFFANCWMYEATLGTNGIQQIGWATRTCKFGQEEGVGDTRDSYAFDGSRVKKWCVDHITYGQAWAPGDVIGCCADFDNGEISFYRNGKSLGVAFDNISTMLPDLVYFPAISLSNDERCTLNFGAKPFQYPVEGYYPCQSPPNPTECQLVKYLMGCMERLTEVTNSIDVFSSNGHFTKSKFALDDKVLMAGLLLKHLGPYLRNDYHLVKVLIPSLRRMLGKSDAQQKTAIVSFLELLCCILRDEQFESLMGRIYKSIATYCCISPFKSSEVPFTASYPHLSLLVAILKYPAAKQVFFSHPRFHYLLEKCLIRKQPTAEDLEELLRNVWWKGCKDESMTEDIMISVTTTLTNAFRKIEEMQSDLLHALLFHQNHREERSCSFNEERLLQFASYLLRKNCGVVRDIQPPGLSDSTVIISFFNFLMKLLRPYFIARKIGGSNFLQEFPTEELFIKGFPNLPSCAFDDLPRLGGIYSHLMKEMKPREERTDIFVEMESDIIQAEDPTCSLPKAMVPRLFHILLLCYRLGADTSIKISLQQFQNENSLRSSVMKMENKLNNPELTDSEKDHLKFELQNHKSELIQAIRQSAWSKIVWFTSNKQKTIFLFSVYLSKLMLSISSSDDSELFQFVPEVYVEAVLDLFQALAKITPRFGNLLQLELFGLQHIFSFLIRNFNNALILNPQISDTMLLTLATIAIDKELLRACERNHEAQDQLIPDLLKAFDTRHWLSVTNIILSIGKGTGFGHASTTSGSLIFRDLFRTICTREKDLLNGFLNRLFNTLNWTLTEMVTTLGEWAQLVQQHVTDHVSPALSRQPRKASLLFHLSTNLLRLLELVANQVPDAFVKGSKLNMVRVIEVVGYVLSHTTEGADSTPFNTIISSNMSSGQDGKFKMSRLSILAPVAGVMVALHMNEYLQFTRESKQGGEIYHSMVKVLVEELACPVSALHSLLSVGWKSYYSNIYKTTCIPRLRDLIKEYDQAKKETTQKALEDSINEQIPEEFVDPILMTIMKDPVILPDSKVVVDRETIERNLLTNPTDPFSRAPLTVEMLQPDPVLKEKIRQWTIDEKSLR